MPRKDSKTNKRMKQIGEKMNIEPYIIHSFFSYMYQAKSLELAHFSLVSCINKDSSIYKSIRDNGIEKSFKMVNSSLKKMNSKLEEVFIARHAKTYFDISEAINLVADEISARRYGR